MTASIHWGLHLYRSCYYGISLMGREFCGEKEGLSMTLDVQATDLLAPQGLHQAKYFQPIDSRGNNPKCFIKFSWVSDRSYKGKKTKLKSTTLALLLHSWRTGSVAPAKDKNKLFEGQFPDSSFSMTCSNGSALDLICFLPHLAFCPLEANIPQQAFTGVESSLRVEKFPDRHNIFCHLLNFCKPGPEVGSWGILPSMF